MKRRFFIFNLLILLSIFLYKIYKYLTFPTVKTEKIVKIPLKSIKDGVNEFFNDEIIVIKIKEKFLVLSSVCTHLGCTVKFNKDKNFFQCPCHKSIFSVYGEVIKGPAKKPLKKLDFFIKNQKLIIRT